MSERRRPPRRGRGPRPSNNRNQGTETDDTNPYRDADAPSDERNGGGDTGMNGDAEPAREQFTPVESRTDRADRPVERPAEGSAGSAGGEGGTANDAPPPQPQQQHQRHQQGGRQHGQGGQHQQHNRNRDGNNGNREGGRRGRRNRGRGQRRGGGAEHHERGGQAVIVAVDGEATGWYDQGRDGGYIRRASASYLAEPGDAFVPMQLARQIGLRRGDLVEAATGRDQRGRTIVAEVKSVNGGDPALALRRADFSSLPASYPERKLFLETGRPAKGGAELIRRAIDLIAPIGFGQRGLIVAPARAGKTTLLHAVTEGVALNHPNAALLILLVDERPEEVSEAISWGVGEVIASSFDQPAARHVEVTDIVLERARRMVETGKDVVIVLDSLTRMARAHNTAERGTGRTLSGGLDATAMAKPKAFFGSARAIPTNAGGGSLTIIATALVETGSRMDDVIFEEFKGTGNSEIKLDRSLAEKRIYPAIDIATSGTRREEKLFRPDQLDAVYTLRRGLSQMPPQAGMEWLIKRIAATTSNDALLSGL
ncbi:MAG TPA: transcription termination factor Rho [Gemmatimonadaceae bacterium]|nr:transcription termination factor Rho [Gemmatimonadaceae bacterium]